MLRSLKECFNKKAFWGFLSDSRDPILIGFHLLHLCFSKEGIQPLMFKKINSPTHKSFYQRVAKTNNGLRPG